jgi:hypothetical protein
MNFISKQDIAIRSAIASNLIEAVNKISASNQPQVMMAQALAFMINQFVSTALQAAGFIKNEGFYKEKRPQVETKYLRPTT